MKKLYLYAIFVSALILLALTTPAMADSTNGKFSEIPAYYDAKLFTITFQELPSGGEASVLMHNKSVNHIYRSDQAEACGTPVTSVIDAIQGDGFNPLWQEVQITYKGGCGSVIQFTRDDDILAQAGVTIELTYTTEVYTCSVVGTKPDPASGTWALTGSLKTSRIGHTATLLPNGQVLAVGGSGKSGQFLASAELYNPATGRWSTTGSMSTVRYGHTATLLPNGLVLVAGGLTSIGTTTATAELYDPATGQWRSTGSMTAARFSHSAVLLPGGEVLVAGGMDKIGLFTQTVLNSAELYDPSNGTWQATGSMNFPRASQAVLLQNGKVLIADGQTAELFSNGQWTLTANMNESHASTTAAPLPNGGALVCGRSITFSAFCEFYNPSSNTWTLAHSTGSDPIATPLLLLGTGKVLMAGGRHSDGVSNICELFDVSTNTWLGTGFMNSQRVGHSLTLLPNGQVLAAGGENATSQVLNSAELYTP